MGHALGFATDRHVDLSRLVDQRHALALARAGMGDQQAPWRAIADRVFSELPVTGLDRGLYQRGLVGVAFRHANIQLRHQRRQRNRPHHHSDDGQQLELAPWARRALFGFGQAHHCYSPEIDVLLRPKTGPEKQREQCRRQAEPLHRVAGMPAGTHGQRRPVQRQCGAAYIGQAGAPVQQWQR